MKDYYFPDPNRQADKRARESVVQIFRDVWNDLTQNVDVIYTDQNPFTPPAGGKPLRLKEWCLDCSDHTVTIKIKAARIMLDKEFIIIRRYPMGEGFWTMHKVDIIDNGE